MIENYESGMTLISCGERLISLIDEMNIETIGRKNER